LISIRYNSSQIITSHQFDAHPTNQHSSVAVILSFTGQPNHHSTYKISLSFFHGNEVWFALTVKDNDEDDGGVAGISEERDEE